MISTDHLRESHRSELEQALKRYGTAEDLERVDEAILEAVELRAVERGGRRRQRRRGGVEDALALVEKSFAGGVPVTRGALQARDGGRRRLGG